MKKSNPIIIIMPILWGLFINSCIKKEDPVTMSSSVIKNNSNHSLQIKIYRKNIITDDLFLANNEHKEFKFQETYGNMFLFEFSDRDSALVIFGQKDSIMHYPDGNKGAARSILKLNSWEQIEARDYWYEYEYVFTDNDYLEASQ